MKTRMLLGALIFFWLGVVPATVNAAPPHINCKYVVGLRGVITDLNTLVRRMPKLGNQQAHDQGLAVDLRFARFNRKATPLPVDLTRAFAATVQNLGEGAANRAHHNTDQYNHFFNQTRKYMGATWSAYQRHYGKSGCK